MAVLLNGPSNSAQTIDRELLASDSPKVLGSRYFWHLSLPRIRRNGFALAGHGRVDTARQKSD